MQKLVGWIIFFTIVYFGHQAGWFDYVINYFSDASRQAREERVIEHPDGSITTVKYRNIFDLLLKKEK